MVSSSSWKKNSLHEIVVKFLRVDLTEFFQIPSKHNVEITEIYSSLVLFWQKFRESNAFT